MISTHEQVARIDLDAQTTGERRRLFSLKQLAAGLGALVSAAVLAGEFSPRANSADGLLATVANGKAVIDGKPIIIEGAYGPCESDFDAAMQLNPNLFAGDSCGSQDFQVLAQKADQLGIYVASNYNYGKGYTYPITTNTIMRWEYPDEPDDPNPPVPPIANIINPTNLPLGQNFTRCITGLFPQDCKPLDYSSYTENLNIVGFDDYWYNNSSCRGSSTQPNGLFNEIRALDEQVYPRAVTPIIEANQISPNSCPNPVNGAIEKNLIIQTILGYAAGYMVYTQQTTESGTHLNYSVSWDVAQGIRAANAEINMMNDVITQGAPLRWDFSPQAAVVGGAWAFDGKEFLWIENTQSTAQPVNVQLPVEVGSLHVVGESRDIAGGNTLQDQNLAPFEDRIYTVGKVLGKTIWSRQFDSSSLKPELQP